MTSVAFGVTRGLESSTGFVETVEWKYHMTGSSLSTRIIFTGLCALTFAAGVAGNVMVVATVARDKKMHTVTNYFIVNLAVADLLVLIFCLPASVVPVYLYGWHLGSALCKFIPFIQSVTISVSVNSMVAISFDRYLAICQVFEFHVTRNMARFIIIGLWCFACFIFVPFLITYRVSEAEGYQGIHTCIQEWPALLYDWIYFITAEFFLSFTLPLVVATIFYIMIAYRVWFRPLLGAEGTSFTAIQRSKVRALKMIIAVLLLFAICWFPLHIFVICLYLVPMDKKNEILVTSTFYIKWLALSNSAINPVVYFFFSNKYRKGFNNVCSSCSYAKEERQTTITRSQELAKKQVYYRSQTTTNRMSNAQEGGSKRTPPRSERSSFKNEIEVIDMKDIKHLK